MTAELQLLRKLLDAEKAKNEALKYEVAECKEALGDWRELYDDLQAAKLTLSHSHPNRRVEDPGYYYDWYAAGL